MRDGRPPMMEDRGQSGFSLIEVLVTIALFSVAAAAFYQVMFSGVRASDTTRNIVRISEEARFGFNRMVRDTREAARITAATPGVSYTIEVDFNGNNLIEAGEVETFTYDDANDQITISAGGVTEALIRGVHSLGGEVFSFSNNELEFDHNPPDGIVTWQEVDTPPTGVTGGNRDGQLNAGEYPYLTNVNFAIRVTAGNRSTDFFAEAQLRNRR